jgi:hypothetical protein
MPKTLKSARLIRPRDFELKKTEVFIFSVAYQIPIAKGALIRQNVVPRSGRFVQIVFIWWIMESSDFQKPSEAATRSTALSGQANSAQKASSRYQPRLIHVLWSTMSGIRYPVKGPKK